MPKRETAKKVVDKSKKPRESAKMASNDEIVYQRESQMEAVPENTTVSEMTGKLHIDPLWLNEVLDLIGISENMRKLYQQYGTRCGILNTLTQTDYSAYTFGSSCEGTTTPGMASDVDLMKCDSKFVIEFCNPGLPGRYRLIVRDENTRPGYVKLQLVEDGKPLTSSDWEMIPKELRYLFKVDLKDRIVISMEPIIGEEVGPEREIHGPAERLKVSSLMELDNVYSCRCASWPPFAMKWIFRQREYNWPPDDIIEQFQNWACFLVRTGHPLSEEKELEWRISFSLQERALVFSFNETQYKCFVLLKLIKDDIIKTDIGESITSYHCKTCMFYALEETPEQMWVKSNLLKCLMYCLKLLLSYVESWNCPNYFIPNENMFDRLERCSTQTRLKNLITGLIDEGPPFLLRIKTDKIGEYLSNVRDCSKILELKEFSKNCVASMACSLHWGLVTEVLLVKNLLLHKLNTLTQESNFDLVIKHHALLDKLLNTNVITEHSQDQTEDAIGMVIPFIQSSTACHLMSYALQEKNQTVRNVLTVVAAKHFSESIKSDVSSCRMKFATVLLNLGHYDSCAKLLDTVEVEFKNGTSLMNTCTCRELPPMLGEKLSKNVKYDNIQTNEFLQSYVSTCVMFLPSEIHIIPEALRFEMFRSAGTPSDSLMKMAEICYKCSAVDSIVYLYFMRYLLAVKEGKQKQIRDLAIKNIEQSLNQSLNHRETAFNLLAWVLFRETCYIRAIKSLIASWRELEGYDLYLHKTDIMKDFQSHHNAAKWHMLVFLYNLWTNNIDSEKYKFCFGCLEPDLNRDVLITCSQCHVAKYCSKKCQAKDWRNHKTACRMKAKSDLLA